MRNVAAGGAQILCRICLIIDVLDAIDASIGIKGSIIAYMGIKVAC